MLLRNLLGQPPDVVTPAAFASLALAGRNAAAWPAEQPGAAVQVLRIVLAVSVSMARTPA